MTITLKQALALNKGVFNVQSSTVIREQFSKDEFPMAMRRVRALIDDSTTRKMMIEFDRQQQRQVPPNCEVIKADQSPFTYSEGLQIHED